MERRLLVFFAFLALGIGPCGPVPGGRLGGSDSPAAPPSWAVANEVPRCAVEVRPAAPRSVTVNCMSWEGRLFVSCSVCARKTWASYVADDPRGRVRVGDAVYPVKLVRVTEAALLDEVWRARARKLGNDASEPRPEGWWSFELSSR